MTLDLTPAVIVVRTPPKMWYMSRTMWLNLLTAVIVGGGTFLSIIGTIKVDPGVVAAITILVAVANAMLRMDTDQAITFNPAETKKDAIAIKPLTPTGSGQGLVEYALIIALIAVMLIAALIVLRGQIEGVFTSIGSAL